MLRSLTNRLTGYFGSWDAFKWPFKLCRGGHCREVKIRVDLWTVCWDQTKWPFKEVAVSGGSTVCFRYNPNKMLNPTMIFFFNDTLPCDVSTDLIFAGFCFSRAPVHPCKEVQLTYTCIYINLFCDSF